MISIFPSGAPQTGNPVWIDLLNGTQAEVSEAEGLAHLRAPTRDALSEIETSSRIFFENDALYLSMPLVTPEQGASEQATFDQGTTLTPIGFVLSKDVLLTVRFGPAPAVDAVSDAVKDQKSLQVDDVFAQILEAMVDRAADRLEHLGAALDGVSRSTFSVDRARGRKVAKAGDALRAVLRKIGQTGDRLSQIRDTLLGLDRICAFIAETPRCDFSEGVIHRLKAAHADIASLNSYEEHLSNKVQFLLDATLGFINIEQNDTVKILTVVSVVGVPPVLIAGIYGMNFKAIPEYDWHYGYPYSLVLMAVSALIPMLWFKWRGWL